MGDKCGMRNAECGMEAISSAPLSLRRPASRVPRHSALRTRSGFTLTELLIVMMILGIMTGLALSGLAGALDLAKEQRTRAIISKLDQLIMERYEGYRTRSVPLPQYLRTGATPQSGARTRLNALRELMRMELPDCMTDILDFRTNPPSLRAPATGIAPAALQKTYYRMMVRAVGGNPANLSNLQATSSFEGSECLYMIISTMHDGDKNALDYFLGGEIGDTDGDGLNEILDGWGNPIEFIRWAPGYAEQKGQDGQWGIAGTDDDGNGVTDDVLEAGWPGSDDYVPPTMQTRNYLKAPDPFDPAKADPRWATPVYPNYATIAPQPYYLHPLIFSAGRDRIYAIDVGGNKPLSYYTGLGPSNNYPAVPPNDPYWVGGQPSAGAISVLGRPNTVSTGGSVVYDDITNHYQATP
jgi:prepilin-type N-terminal cleavage/methylation domain-containing protein